MEQAGLTGTQEIASTVRQFIVENFLFGAEPESFSGNDSFLQKGIIDSTGILELVEFLEATFGISIEDQEMLPQNLDSLNNVASFIKRKKGITN